MKVDHIIENGYGKLAEYLPAWQRGFLEGLKEAIDCVEGYMAFEYDDSEAEGVLEKIEYECGRDALEGLIEKMKCWHGENLIALVEGNDEYELDEQNRVVRVSDGKVMNDERPENKEGCWKRADKPCAYGSGEGDCQNP